MPDSENSAARIGWVTCNGCGETADLMPGQGSDPDAAVTCAPDSGCCQVDHGPGGHAGNVCDRTVTIYALAALSGEGA